MSPIDLITQHLVRYKDLIPCTTAFIDTRTPGSKEKENFTIIGPGVAENPDQHVHITRAHGFNIGAARQPRNCINSQHSHDTAEVFIVHTGTWSFSSGEHGEDGKVTLTPGDTISIPTKCFRGFENIGSDTGFLFAILGGDDPGQVTWAPHVLEQAKSYGLVLLENGALVDTVAGEAVPADILPMPPTSQAIIEGLQKLSSLELEACVVRHAVIAKAPSAQLNADIIETHLLGTANSFADKPPLNWPHGFQIKHLSVAAGGRTEVYRQHQEEVFLIQSGSMDIELLEQTITLSSGDVFTAPIDAARCIANPTPQACEAYVVHGNEAATRIPPA